MKTEIIVIADESGSMHGLMDDANGGYQNFVNEQRDVPGEARVTLVKFANHVHRVFQGQDIKTVGPLDLRPRGNTALYDAIGMTLGEQQDRIKKEAWADLVVVMVMTDGQENASVEYSKEGIATIVKMAESNGWKFIWMMSNQDAFETSRSMGSASGMVLNKAATSQGERDSYAYASVQTRSLRSGDKA